MVDICYNGFGAWCAAYAFLNTTQCSDVTPELYELLSGVPFGIKYNPDNKSRLLSPFIEPCLRVNDVSKMLGYSAKLSKFKEISEAVYFLSSMDCGKRVMIGPIDMGHLAYLPLNMYYIKQSHYISVEKQKDDKYCVTDSEGILLSVCSQEYLSGIINVSDIPESENNINIWEFELSANRIKTSEYADIIRCEACKNLVNAEEAGQGSNAILQCADLLEYTDSSCSDLRLYYEFNYVLQRKLLAHGRFRCHNKYQTKILEKQINIFCHIRDSVICNDKMDYNLLRVAADYEYELANSTQG